MKYIKTFENIGNNKFKIDNIVVAYNVDYKGDRSPNLGDNFVFNEEFVEFLSKTPVRIIKIINDKIFVKYDLPDIFVDEDDINNQYEVYFHEDELRFASPEEIKQLKIQEDIIKYNL